MPEGHLASRKQPLEGYLLVGEPYYGQLVSL